MGSPEAADEILAWVGEAGLQVSPLPLQNALINCCRESPRMLLPYLQHADKPVREVLARVLSEIPTGSLDTELVAMAEDELPELRAAAARAFSNMGSGHALDTLSELARDSVWFVRLRAVVALGKVHDSETIPPLLHSLTDSNRLVRMRAAEGLVDHKAEMAQIFAKVVATQDRYGFYAYLAALENAGLRQRLEAGLQQVKRRDKAQAEKLLAVLRAGKLLEAKPVESATEVTAGAGRS
jgi:HEAT repeat protein